MEAKRVQASVKLAGETGEFRCIFSTLGVIDLDNDVTVPGAFQEGQHVKVAAWGHRWDQLPVGAATIHADQHEAWADGQFFLDTQSGREHFAVAKALGPSQEWSFGFSILASHPGSFQDRPVRFLDRLDVHEVSQVMVGAGIGTRTVAVRGQLSPEQREARALQLRRLEREVVDLEREERQLLEVKRILVSNERALQLHLRALGRAR